MRYVDIEIAADADECYRALCDIDAVPAWVDGVTSVRVDQRDDRGRAVHARFIGGSGSAQIVYALDYAYDDDARRVTWRLRESRLRDLDGEAIVSPAGPGRCRLRYGLRASTLVFRAGNMRLEEEEPERVAEGFRRWLESRGDAE